MASIISSMFYFFCCNVYGHWIRSK